VEHEAAASQADAVQIAAMQRIVWFEALLFIDVGLGETWNTEKYDYKQNLPQVLCNLHLNTPVPVVKMEWV
jgi:hypothetical protein